MFARLLAATLASGVLAGFLISAVQEVTTTPLILQAETYETRAAAVLAPAQAMLRTRIHGDGAIRFVHGDESSGGAVSGNGNDAAWSPEDGIERTLFTVLTNIVTGVAFAALLVAAFGLRGAPISSRKGVVWGLAGFAVFAAAPSLGLPPEVPGAMAADLGIRQVWWALTAASTAAGLWLLVFQSRIAFHVAGVALLALPHLIGAPHPEHVGGPVPPELAGQFVSASLVTSLVFWAMLGWLAGRFYEQLVSRRESTV